MSEEENLENTEEEVIEVAEPPKVSATEAKAREKGWLPGDELKAKLEADGREYDPDMVVSARQYIEKGEMISEINRLRRQSRETDKRLADNNAFWKAQLEAQKTALQEKRDEAIDLADKDTVNAIDGEIASIDKQAEALDTEEQIDIVDVEAENTYFASLTAGQKPYAQQVAAVFINQGFSGADLVEKVNEEVLKQFPPTNQRRETAPVTEAKTRGSKRKEDAITVDSLKAEDRQALAAMKRVSPLYAKKSDAEILKIIEDSKK